MAHHNRSTSNARNQPTESYGFNLDACRIKIKGIRLELRLLQLKNKLTEDQLRDDIKCLELLIEENKLEARIQELSRTQASNEIETFESTTPQTAPAYEQQQIANGNLLPPDCNLSGEKSPISEATVEISDHCTSFTLSPDVDEAAARSQSYNPFPNLIPDDSELCHPDISATGWNGPLLNFSDYHETGLFAVDDADIIVDENEDRDSTSTLDSEDPNTVENNPCDRFLDISPFSNSMTEEADRIVFGNYLETFEQPGQAMMTGNLMDISTTPWHLANIPSAASPYNIDPLDARTISQVSTQLRTLKPKPSVGVRTPTKTRPKVTRKQQSQRKKKQPFQSETSRQATAQTRIRGVCVKCRTNKERCDIDPEDPEGPCLGCRKLGSSALGHPCIRWKLATLSLYRDETTPWPGWTTRYNSMEAKNITGWANDEVKILQCSHKIQNASYSLHVRNLVPIPGDMLCETWFDKSVGEFKTHDIEPYAVVDLGSLKQEMQRYVNDSIVQFIVSIMGESDDLLWNTYQMAFKRCLDNRVRDKERRLLLNTLRLWVTSRISSMPENVCGDEKIGTRVDDKSSPYYGTYPLSPVIYAQEEIVLLTQIQRPLQRDVMADLDALMKVNTRESWFTIYLTLFILLHSCSLTSRRDEEFASQMKLKTPFANPKAIYDNQTGVIELIREFHLHNKGEVPFTMSQDPSKHNELAAAAKLDADQLQFVVQTSLCVSQKVDMFQDVKRRRQSTDDYYFVSQLYEQRWNPPVAMG